MLISVCMATYNGARFLREQVDSILHQEFTENENVEMELIVSDDGSTDETLLILENYHDKRIKIFHHEKVENRRHKYYDTSFSCTQNFEHAISKAQGAYIFLSDQDDVWFPFKIDKTLTALKQKGGVCGTAFYLGGEDLEIKEKVVYRPQPFFTFKFWHFLYGFTCGFPREELKYLLPFPATIPQHDKFIGLTALWRNKLHFIDEPCAIHRWSGQHNVSSTIEHTPAYIRIYWRLLSWAIVIWRSITR